MPAYTVPAPPLPEEITDGLADLSPAQALETAAAYFAQVSRNLRSLAKVAGSKVVSLSVRKGVIRLDVENDGLLRKAVGAGLVAKAE